jgi:hypothetical protein
MMNSFGNLVKWRTIIGDPVNINGRKITPKSKELFLKVPGGFLLWKRPVSVHIEEGPNLEQIPIRDLTRILQISLYSISIFIGIVFWVYRKENKEKKHE